MPVLHSASKVVFDRQATGNDYGHPYWRSLCGNFQMDRWSGTDWRIYDRNGNCCTAQVNYPNRAAAEAAVQECKVGGVQFGPKDLVSQCGRYRLDYKKSTGWRTYRRGSGGSINVVWVVISPGITHDNRTEAIKAVQGYHRGLTGERS
jgi:hypothetical protein